MEIKYLDGSDEDYLLFEQFSIYWFTFTKDRIFGCTSNCVCIGFAKQSNLPGPKRNGIR